LSIEADADLRARGAGITVALCGHWEHEPPCRLAPHHTLAKRVDDKVHLRTLFVVDPACGERVESEFAPPSSLAGSARNPAGTSAIPDPRPFARRRLTTRASSPATDRSCDASGPPLRCAETADPVVFLTAPVAPKLLGIEWDVRAGPAANNLGRSA
jgi:hypothetical protein